MEQILLRLIANAGLLVEYRGLRILVDGIHTNDGLEFDGLPPRLLEQMLCGQGELADLDYLLFTHEHIDHFSPACTQTYLQNNQVRGICLPAAGGRRLAALQDYIDAAGLTCHRQQLSPGSTHTFALEGDASVTAAGFRHMGPQYRDKENDCLLLTLGERKLLITGDADVDPGCFQAAFTGLPMDCLVVNPLFYLDKRCPEALSLLSPRHVLVYHLPDESNGPTVYQRAVEREARKRAPLPYQLTLLTRMGQTISL